MRRERALPPGLPPPGDLTSADGLLAEVLRLGRLAREGRISDHALRVGLEGLDMLGRGLELKARQPVPRPNRRSWPPAPALAVQGRDPRP